MQTNNWFTTALKAELEAEFDKKSAQYGGKVIKEKAPVSAHYLPDMNTYYTKEQYVSEKSQEIQDEIDSAEIQLSNNPTLSEARKAIIEHHASIAFGLDNSGDTQTDKNKRLESLEKLIGKSGNNNWNNIKYYPNGHPSGAIFALKNTSHTITRNPVSQYDQNSTIDDLLLRDKELTGGFLKDIPKEDKNVNSYYASLYTRAVTEPDTPDGGKWLTHFLVQTKEGWEVFYSITKTKTTIETFINDYNMNADIKNTLDKIKTTYGTLNESNTKRTAGLIEGLLGTPKEALRMKGNSADDGYYGFGDRWENVQNQAIQGQLKFSNLQGGLFKELYDIITTNTLDTVQLNNIKDELEKLNLKKHTTGNLGGYDAEQANVEHFKALLIGEIQKQIQIQEQEQESTHTNQNPNDYNVEQAFSLVANTLEYTQNEALTNQMNSVLSGANFDKVIQNNFHTLANAYEKKTTMGIGTYDYEKIQNANATLKDILDTDTKGYDATQRKDFFNALLLLQQHFNAIPEKSIVRSNTENTKNQNIITEIVEKLKAKMVAVLNNRVYDDSHIVSAEAKNILIDIKTKIGDITVKNALWGQAKVPQGEYTLPSTSLYGRLDLLYKNANTNEATKRHITEQLTGISKQIQNKPDKEGAYRFINDTHKVAFKVDVENIKKEAAVNVVNQPKATNNNLPNLFLGYLKNYSEGMQTDLENELLNIESSDNSKNGIVQITREFLSQQNNNSLDALNGKKYILNDQYYLSIQDSKLLKSTDQGKRWSAIQKGDSLFVALKGKITKIEEVENFSDLNQWSLQQQQGIGNQQQPNGVNNNNGNQQQPKNGNNNNGAPTIIPANNGGGVGGNNNIATSRIPGGNNFQQQFGNLSRINQTHRQQTHERIALLGTQYGANVVQTYNINNNSFDGEITTGREFFEHTLSQVGTKEYEKQVKATLQTLISSIGNSKLIADKLVKQALNNALKEVTQYTTYDTIFARVALELRIKTQNNNRTTDVQNCLNRIGANRALHYYSQPVNGNNVTDADFQEHLCKAIAVIARDMTNQEQQFTALDINNIGVILTEHRNYFFGNPTSDEIKSLEDSVNIQPNTAFYNGKQDFINVMKKIAATTQLTWFTATGQLMTRFNDNDKQLFNAIQGMNSANINVLNESLGELKNTNASSRETTEGTLHNMKNGIAQYGIIGGINTDNPNNPTLTNFFGGNGGMNAFLPNESKSHLGESPVNRETRYNNRNQMTREPSEESENNSEVRSNRRTPSFGGIQ